MTATAEAIKLRHQQGLRRLHLRKRDVKADFKSLLRNPPTRYGLKYPDGELDSLLPEQMSGSDVILGGVEGLPCSMVGGDRMVDTRPIFEWLEEHGSEVQRHAWQWWMLERLVRSWVRSYGYVDDREDYLSWFD
ncbi:hypothetical protein [Halomonas alimentaria]|uniref:Uncharacterized protein n=1 Tax=Halomonas alimentaria TaxID=147248 RepID=A0A7X4W5X5_9GAMM|nr:hypothetical protein [Halomonas alimentaria]NAW34990.1 hypothetical protein [Halomonas alimentaria]